VRNLFDGKKLNITQLVTTIGDMHDKLDKLDAISEKLDAIIAQGVSTEGLSVSEITPSVLDPNTWMSIARGYIGLDEHEDIGEQTIIKLSQEAGTPIDNSEIPWCAIFVNGVLALAGLATTGTMRARDFLEYGEECEEKVGAIVVYKSHVGFVSEIGKCLGGNQSDSVCEGQQSWYGKVLGYRWPNG